MKVLVYPHDLEMGGSQTNAIELAAAVSALGHECIVFGRPGSLCERIDELGLEFVASPDPGRRPSRSVVRAVGALVEERGIDVVHGYEWPPALEAEMVRRRTPGVAAVCTVMSMAVAPFIPRGMPLVVGTQQISAQVQQRGHTDVHLIEPPVDLDHNRVSVEAIRAFEQQWGLGDLPVVAIVSRLVPELKAEGIWTAIEVADECASDRPFQLLIVGDGRSRADLERRAQEVNRRHGRAVVVFTGELMDPRPAYGAADVVLGMGGSALRALAFGKPLVVQGERGYFRALGPDSVDVFRWQGWYSVGAGPAVGATALRGELVPLLTDPSLRRRLGDYSRAVVEEFSLERAARTQMTIYRDALAAGSRPRHEPVETARCAAELGRYYLGQAAAKVRGVRRADDFNAAPVAATVDETVGSRPDDRADGPILYFPGVGWDTLAGTDRQLVTELARSREVIWVDTPHAPLLHRRDRSVRLVSQPAPNITRLRAPTLPGVQRPVLRDVANRRRAAVARRFLARDGRRPAAVIASTTAPMLDLTRRLGGVRVYYATDDYVEAAQLWGVDKRYLQRSRERNLRAAHLVLAVSRPLARHLQRGVDLPLVLPNGADLAGLADFDDTPAADVPLHGPIAGIVGQFNSRTDLRLVRAVHDAGVPLMLVGPRGFSCAADDEMFTELVSSEGVHWVGEVPRAELPAYLKVLRVGLTPYADSMFNRRSFPLKTLEYLAAGVRVVASDVAPVDGLADLGVQTAATTEEFVQTVRQALAEPHDAQLLRAAVADQSWADRAAQLGRWLGLTTKDTRFGDAADDEMEYAMNQGGVR